MIRKSLHLPEVLGEAMELRWKQLEYPSLNAYLKGLIAYDCLVQGDHTITRELADAAPHVQDRLHQKALECCQDGSRERGSFLRHLIREIIGEDGDSAPVKKELPKKAVE